MPWIRAKLKAELVCYNPQLGVFQDKTTAGQDDEHPVTDDSPEVAAHQDDFGDGNWEPPLQRRSWPAQGSSGQNFGLQQTVVFESHTTWLARRLYPVVRLLEFTSSKCLLLMAPAFNSKTHTLGAAAVPEEQRGTQKARVNPFFKLIIRLLLFADGPKFCCHCKILVAPDQKMNRRCLQLRLMLTCTLDSLMLRCLETPRLHTCHQSSYPWRQSCVLLPLR